MISRHVFQRKRSPTGTAFLTNRLAGAISYDRIAGYFDSSLFEIAGEAFENVVGKVRMLCNSDIKAADVATAEQAQKLSFFKNDPGSDPKWARIQEYIPRAASCARNARISS